MAAINGQHESKESFYHLEICCRYVGEKYGNPAITEWTNRDYVRLSSILSHKTGTQISPNTLKRIFGKLKTPERYYPQKATRDALARYAGYTDWENFLLQHPRPVRQEEKETEKQVQADSSLQTTLPKEPKKAFVSKWWMAVLLAAIVAVIWWQWPQQASVPAIRPGDAMLTCNNPEGENPHSAVFKLQVPPGFSGDTAGFTINFGDGRPEKPILPNVLLTHYYEIPGRYHAIVKYRAVALDTVAVYLKTTGWTATVTIPRDTTRVYPVITGTLFKNGKMLVSPSEVFHAGVDTNRTFFVNFVNTKPLNISGDNFELMADVTTSPARAGVRCSQVIASIFGQQADHTVFIIKPGCASWINLQFSEVRKRGEVDDLRSLCADFTGGGIFKLQVKDQQVKVWVNDKKVYEIAYQLPVGKIYGVNISFAGIGSVKKLLLKDLATGEVFNDGFSAR